jgi:hypothetical protein
MSREFTVTYYPYPQVDPKTGKVKDVYRPTVPIKISYEGKEFGPFQALVDSGSDRNLFPAEIGEILGIAVKKGKSSPIFGIGKVKILAYTHKIVLYLERCSFEVEVDFSYEQKVPLLGRIGFFNQFKRVLFRERKKEVCFKI